MVLNLYKIEGKLESISFNIDNIILLLLYDNRICKKIIVFGFGFIHVNDINVFQRGGGHMIWRLDISPCVSHQVGVT